jgi:hypothetical protein
MLHEDVNAVRSLLRVLDPANLTQTAREHYGQCLDAVARLYAHVESLAE